jgi:hypothetical protein
LNSTLLRRAEFLCAFTKGEVIKKTFADKMSLLLIIHGTNIIIPNNIGKNTVQQSDISSSKRILGKQALPHINMNINTELFKAIIKLYSSSDPRVLYIRVINPLIFSNNGSKIIKIQANMNSKTQLHINNESEINIDIKSKNIDKPYNLDS